mmetsp:Transcript_17575/g.29671  ORF Transcript_17575/g.29671 Transcript_17575/m.29671 type:complete len:154 (-) Transcript_17575:219-680(-)
MKVIDLLQQLLLRLEAQNDGNKVYKIKAASKALGHPPLKNYAALVESVIEKGTQLFVELEIGVDKSKHVKPLQVNQAASGALRNDPKKPAESTIIGESATYKTIVKYTYYESGTKYIKVLLDFPDAKALIKREQVRCSFETRSFEILVHDFKG